MLLSQRKFKTQNTSYATSAKNSATGVDATPHRIIKIIRTTKGIAMRSPTFAGSSGVPAAGTVSEADEPKE